MMKTMKIPCVRPVLGKESQTLGIAISFLDNAEDEPSEAEIIPLASALALLGEIDGVMTAMRDQEPLLYMKSLKQGLPPEGVDCDCDTCELVKNEIADAVAATGICPTHGVQLDGGCPLCEMELS